MTRNVGSIDRVLRVLIGLALIVASLTGAIGLWGISESSRCSPRSWATAPPTA